MTSTIKFFASSISNSSLHGIFESECRVGDRFRAFGSRNSVSSSDKRELMGGAAFVNAEKEIRCITDEKKSSKTARSCQELEVLWDDGYGTSTVKDYLDVSREIVNKPDGGPPRWFFPVECGKPIKGSPVLHFLPGMDGTGWGLGLHHKSLGKVFEVRCLHIPVNDRTPLEGKGGPPLTLPLSSSRVFLPKIPGRFYYLFGKPIETKGMKQESKDKDNANAMYLQIKSEVENIMSYLVKKREKDPYRGIPQRTIYKAIKAPADQVPAFEL